jgi:anaerobic selenocysteine-containing dehydrogenase
MTVSQALEVRPDATFPVNRGQMCTKGFTSAHLLDHAERVTTPLLRGPDGRFAPASWETALDFIAERLLAIRAAHGSEALAALPLGQVRPPGAPHAPHRLQRTLLHVLGGGRAEPRLRDRPRAAVSGQ